MIVCLGCGPKKVIYCRKTLYMILLRIIRSMFICYFRFGPYETDASISFEDRVQLVGELYKFQTKAFEKYLITS